MTSRDDRILDAALQLVGLHGIRRVTMADVAEAAGVSRQTVYNAFSNKDVLLAAAVARIADVRIDAMAASARAAGSFADRLDVIFEHMARRPYRLVALSQDGHDVIGALKSIAPQELARSDDRYIVAISAILEPDQEVIGGLGLRTEDLADLLVRTTTAFKESSKSAEHLEVLIRSLGALLIPRPPS